MDARTSPAPRPTLDLGYAIKMPFQDPSWVGKGLVLGLILLIPFAGVLVLFGWSREIYDRGLRGEGGLPDLDFGRHLSYGLTPLLAMLNLALVMLAVMLALGLAGAAAAFAVQSLAGSDAAQVLGPLLSIAMFGAQMLMMALMLGVQLTLPELLRRGFNGEAGPLFSPAASIAAIRSQPSNYIVAFIGMMVANMIGAAGMFACYVGALVTMPLGYAITANLLAQWDRMVRGGDRSLAGVFE